MGFKPTKKMGKKTYQKVHLVTFPGIMSLESKALASTPEAPWDPQKKHAAAWEMVSTKGFLPQSLFFVYTPEN